MTWCPHCAQNRETHRDYTTGTDTVCCVDCGKVVSQDTYTEDATFVQDACGGARLAGNLVKLQSACSESHKRTLNKGNEVISHLIIEYGISNVDHATKYYEIAVERGFTRGRRTKQVAAACLYVACREMEKPYLLIEFTSKAEASVYELGTVYLQLCKLLSLQDHPFVQKPVDPSLYMHRYTSVLMKDGNCKQVLNTALHLAVSMKRDWIQTGRKPSGICAAAIYVSSILHGYNFSKTDVVTAVHICEETLTKRLIEFENTEAGSLTIEEFTQNAMDYEKEMQSCKQSANNLKMPGMTDVVCQHKSSVVQSGFGLCKDCYLEFCGGLGGSEPPAFQRAQVEGLTESTSQQTVDSENVCVSGKAEKASDTVESSEEAPAVDETDTLNEIDDSDVAEYLLDEEESRLKKIIWEHMNPEDIMLQQAAARKGNSVEAHVKKEHKERRKRELEASAQTAAEAACQHFKKRYSNINYNMVAYIFGDDEVPSPRIVSMMVPTL